MSLIYNGTEITAVNYNGTALDKVIYNGVEVFSAGAGDLCFTANAGGSIKFSVVGTIATPPTLQYKINEGSWNSYTLGTDISLSTDDKCYFKGDNSTFSVDLSNYINFSSTMLVNATGSITSLYDSTGANLTIPSGYFFAYLFNNCTRLETAPLLPATTLQDYCYYGMFNGCTALTSTPALPATTLTNSCYFYMFWNCTSLSTIGAISAVTATGVSCCEGMFFGCTSITTMPDLNATTLGVRCYEYMFNGCTSLTTLKPLTATMVEKCYYGMFYGCTGIVDASVITIPATPSVDCCALMFQNCAALTTPPTINITDFSADNCCDRMFMSCSALKVAQGSGTTFLTVSTITGSDAVYRMFRSTGGSFTSAPTAGNSYGYYY